MPTEVTFSNYPPVYCDIHGAFLEDCDLEGYGECTWYYDEESNAKNT